MLSDRDSRNPPDTWPRHLKYPTYWHARKRFLSVWVTARAAATAKPSTSQNPSPRAGRRSDWGSGRRAAPVHAATSSYSRLPSASRTPGGRLSPGTANECEENVQQCKNKTRYVPQMTACTFLPVRANDGLTHRPFARRTAPHQKPPLQFVGPLVYLLLIIDCSPVFNIPWEKADEDLAP